MSSIVLPSYGASSPDAWPTVSRAGSEAIAPLPTTPDSPDSLKQQADERFAQGVQQFNAGQWAAATSTWRQALELYQTLAEPNQTFTDSTELDVKTTEYLTAIASTQQNLVAALLKQGERDEAIALLLDNLSINQTLGNATATANSNYALANLYAQAGRYRDAIAPYQQSLRFAEDRKDDQRLPIVQGNLAIAYKITGQYREALKANTIALELLQQQKRPSLRSRVLRNQGNVYEALGDYQQATLLFEESLAIAETLGDYAGQAIAWNSLGGVAANEGDIQRAVAAYKTSVDIATTNNQRSSLGSSWLNWGAAVHQQGNTAEAIGYYEKSLAIAEQIGDRKLQAEALGSLGVAYDSQQQFGQAEDFLQRSLAISREMGDRPSESMTLNNLGHALYAAGNLAEAKATLRETLSVLDDLRQGLNDLDKVSLFDTQAKTYNLLQQVLIAQGQPETALEVAEWGRGRAFADLLVQRSGSTFNAGQTEILAQAAKPPKLEELKQVARSQQATLVEYTLVPQDDFLHQGKQLGIPEAIFIWVIQPDGSVHHRQADLKPLLDQKQSLDDLVRLSRCFEPDIICRRRLRRVRGDFQGGDRGPRFVNPEPKPQSEAVLPTELSEQQQTQPAHPNKKNSSKTGNSKISQRNFSALQALHSLLIDPIADLLPGSATERVLFIPQGSLFLVPFPALQSAEGSFLIERHTLLTAPSIQALALTKQRTAQRERQSETSSRTEKNNDILIVGNPTMPAIALKPSQPPTPLSPLPGSEAEAVAIAHTLGTTPLLGEAAREAAVLERLPRAKWIHLATHGLLDYGLQTRQQTIPGAMALAPSLSQPDIPTSQQLQASSNDGLLTATEIIDLDLVADLVVLSACDTGRGDVTGDGVVGLSRAWMGAGAPSLVVSLWAVSDESTAVLMEHFYANLNQGLDKATSLRRAILETATDYDNPFDWAAFSLVGLAE